MVPAVTVTAVPVPAAEGLDNAASEGKRNKGQTDDEKATEVNVSHAFDFQVFGLKTRVGFRPYKSLQANLGELTFAMLPECISEPSARTPATYSASPN